MVDPNPMFYGMIFEVVIICIGFVMLILIFRKYLEKRHRLTLYLFTIFLCFTIAIIFSCLSKVLRLYSGLDYLTNPSVADPGTIESWFFLRIVAFRISFVFVTIAILFSYILKINLFEKEANKVHKKIVFIYAGVTIIYMLVVYIKGNMLLDLLTFSIIALFMGVINFAFMLRCLEAYRNVEDPTFRRAFLSLSIMALCYMLIFVFQIIDRILMMTLNIIGYTIFYYLGWIIAIVTIICAYLGYIRPKSKES